MNSFKMQVLGDHLLVKIDIDNRSKSGLHIVRNDVESNVGKVAFVGPGIVNGETGERLIVMRVKVGDTVMFANDFLQVEYDGYKFYAMRQDNVIGIIQD